MRDGAANWWTASLMARGREMMKPRSIVNFQRLLLAFSLLTILNIVGHSS
jgi:uncharacterized protein (DUF1800 family)